MTEIELGYVRQGYQLPAGMTWEQVSEARAKYSIGEIYVPVGTAPAAASGECR